MIDTLNKALSWRYAVKKFDPTKKIPTREWEVIKESLRLSPSSYGLQPWLFLEIDNRELRQKLREHSWNQSQVTDASHYVVLAYHQKVDEAYISKYVEEIAKQRQIPLESLMGFQKSMVQDLVLGPRSQVIEPWAQRQVYIAMGFALLAASFLGIDTCPMEGINPAEYDRLLGLDSGPYKTLAAIAFGYRHPEDSFAQLKKIRFSAEQVWKKI
jgi:nitroreductase